MATVTIERLGHEGDGIAPGPVYVRCGLPGEVIEGEVDGDRMTEPRIVTPSSERVKPPCPHANGCGGCALQHASDRFVESWKAEVVAQALAARDLPQPMRPVLTSPARSRRRATLSGRRTKKGAIIGFHGRASGSVVPIPSCILLEPKLMQTLPALEQMTRLGGSRKGEISFAVTLTEAGVDVAVSGAKPADLALQQDLAAVCADHPIARLTWEDELIVMAQALHIGIGPAKVPLPPGAFLQATEQGQADLLAAVSEAVGDARRVIDLFAGLGTFSLPLAARVEVHAVEGELALLEALDAGWRGASHVRDVTTERRDLFRNPVLAEELTPRFEAAVIDPPRAGGLAQTEQLAASGIPRIAAVSCNPVTFARDAACLIGAGYSLDWVQVVDQFRWSTHVEMVAQFTRS